MVKNFIVGKMGVGEMGIGKTGVGRNGSRRNGNTLFFTLASLALFPQRVRSLNAVRFVRPQSDLNWSVHIRLRM